MQTSVESIRDMNENMVIYCCWCQDVVNRNYDCLWQIVEVGILLASDEMKQKQLNALDRYNNSTKSHVTWLISALIQLKI